LAFLVGCLADTNQPENSKRLLSVKNGFVKTFLNFRITKKWWQKPLIVIASKILVLLAISGRPYRLAGVF